MTSFRVYDEMTREKVYSSKQLSDMVFGEKDYMDRVGSASRKVNATDADYVELINGYLDQKMVLPFNGHRASRNTAVFESVAEGSGSQALENVRSTLKEYGLAYLPQKKVPEWMMRKCSEETCIKNAGYYLGIAQEMNAKGRKSIRIGTDSIGFLLGKIDGVDSSHDTIATVPAVAVASEIDLAVKSR